MNVKQFSVWVYCDNARLLMKEAARQIYGVNDWIA
jgi:hypothetical protein